MNGICPKCFKAAIYGDICANCGYYEGKETNPLTLPEFTVLRNRYTIGTTLGIGGFGITYIAWDSYTNTKKAIKEYFPNRHTNRDGYRKRVIPLPGETEIFSKGLDKFSTEASILLSMGGIASVVKVEDFFKENSTAYMVMEYVDGVSLRDVCKSQGGTVPVNKAIGEFVALAKTLEQIHVYNLLHRDVSPDNIMMLPDGSVKLIDFGAARFVDSGGGHGLTVVLKPGFAPVEQYSAKGEQGAWTDIYGLACCMYWYLSGVKAPDAMDRLKGKSVEPLHKLRPEISKNLSDVINKAMALDRKQRYQNVAQMLSDLDVQTDIVRSEQPPAPKLKELFRKEKKKNKIFFAQFIGGPFDGYIFPFSGNKQLVLGRNEQYCNGVIPPVNVISRKHCSIEINENTGTMVITDHSSTGTYLSGGTRLEKEKPTVVDINTEFWLAEPRYKIQIIAVDE